MAKKTPKKTATAGKRAMPAFTKSPPALAEAFARALPDDPRVERRQMFGYPCAFVGGNMFAGLFQDRMFVRLAEPEREELLALPGGGPFEPMPGRPMKDYATVPPQVSGDRAALARWIGRALAHGASLPPKEPKAKRGPGGKPKSKR